MANKKVQPNVNQTRANYNNKEIALCIIYWKTLKITYLILAKC